MSGALLDTLSGWRWARALAALGWLSRGLLYHLLGARYRAMEDICRAARVSGTAMLERAALSRIDGLLGEIRRAGRNPLVAWFRSSSRSRRLAAIFTQAGGGPNDLLRDLIVLKSARDCERGVILLKYARTFEAVVALLDFERLLARYAFVLEPCWAGYCDPALLMFIQPGNPVFVQCFTDEDFAFVERIGPPLHALRLGPADWVDAEVFRRSSSESKQYDLVMVANWAAHKRHAELFRALRRIDDRDIRVLLVGFPWAGRTAEDIRREAAAIGRPNVKVEIVESVPHDEVARLVARSKVFVFLSRKEGDNKALVEAMFADVPAIVYDRSIGGARSRINPATGILSSDEDLSDRIRQMLDRHREFSPRQWAAAHTGSTIATRIVDDALQQVARERNEPYSVGIVEKVNAPNLAYRRPEMRERFRHDYDFIAACLRRQPVS